MVTRSVSFLCLAVCPVWALTFESLDLETFPLVRRYVFRKSRSIFLCQGYDMSRSKSLKQKSGSNECD